MSNGACMGRIKAAVSDAGPLIHLQEIHRLSFLEVVNTLLTTRAVLEECRMIIPALKKIKQLRETELSTHSKEIVQFIIHQYELDFGEATALALCQQEKIRLFLTDDLEARETAHTLGLEPHGTLGVISRAFRENIIDKEEALQAVEELYEISTLFLTKSLKDWVIEEIKKYGRK